MIAGYILPFRWQFTKILIGRKYNREGTIVDKNSFSSTHSALLVDRMTPRLPLEAEPQPMDSET